MAVNFLALDGSSLVAAATTRPARVDRHLPSDCLRDHPANPDSSCRTMRDLPRNRSTSGACTSIRRSQPADRCAATHRKSAAAGEARRGAVPSSGLTSRRPFREPLQPIGRRDNSTPKSAKVSGKSTRVICKPMRFAGDDGIYAAGSVKQVFCWAHARRKFFEAKETRPRECACRPRLDRSALRGRTLGLRPGHHLGNLRATAR